MLPAKENQEKLNVKGRRAKTSKELHKSDGCLIFPVKIYLYALCRKIRYYEVTKNCLTFFKFCMVFCICSR